MTELWTVVGVEGDPLLSVCERVVDVPAHWSGVRKNDENEMEK